MPTYRNINPYKAYRSFKRLKGGRPVHIAHSHLLAAVDRLITVRAGEGEGTGYLRTLSEIYALVALKRALQSNTMHEGTKTW